MQKRLEVLIFAKIIKERSIDLDYFVTFTQYGIQELLVKVRTLRQTFFLIVLLHTGEDGFNANSICLGPIQGAGMVARDQICRTN